MLRKLTHRRNGATQGKARLGSLLLSSLPPAFLPQTHPPFPVCPTHSGLSLQQTQRSTHSPKSPSATTTKISQTFHDKFLLSLWKPTPYILPGFLNPRSGMFGKPSQYFTTCFRTATSTDSITCLESSHYFTICLGTPE